MEKNYSTEPIKTLITLLEESKESNSYYREKYFTVRVDLEWLKQMHRTYNEIIARKDKTIKILFFCLIFSCVANFINYFLNK